MGRQSLDRGFRIHLQLESGRHRPYPGSAPSPKPIASRTLCIPSTTSYLSLSRVRAWLPGWRRRMCCGVYEAGSTTPADCVIIPQRARRGVPPKLAEDIGLLEFEEMFASASFLMGVHVLSRGCVLLIHYDQDMDRGYLSSSAFGTVLHSALRPVCVDILLRRRDAGQARFTTRADTHISARPTRHRSTLPGSRSRHGKLEGTNVLDAINCDLGNMHLSLQ